MKTKILIYLLVLTSFIGCTGGSSAPPFNYNDNTRIIIEGKLFDSNQNVLPNQVVELYDSKDNNKLNESFSDANGNFFITSPQGNYYIYMTFGHRNIISTSLDGVLPANTTGIGFQNISYLKIDQIVLTN